MNDKVDLKSWARYEIEKVISETKNDFIKIIDRNGVVQRVNGLYFGRELYALKYSTTNQFKAVIRDLVAAIERGDKTFILPADDKPKNKSAQKNCF